MYRYIDVIDNKSCYLCILKYGKKSLRGDQLIQFPQF